MDSLPADQDMQIVIGLELRLLQPEVRAAPGDVAALLHPDFAEFGASGRRWNRADVIAALAAEQPGAEEPSITVTEMSGTRLEGDVIHLTYTSQRGGRRAHRSSIWLRTDDGWRVYFHQATQLVLDHARRIRPAPPPRHGRLGQDRAQPSGVPRAPRPEPDPPARQHRMRPGPLPVACHRQLRFRHPAGRWATTAFTLTASRRET